MIGSFQIKVSRRRGASFGFTIRRNITVVRGDSGTGKTTLYEMIADYTALGERSGVNVRCEQPCVALMDRDWRHQLAGIKDSIVFIDEGMEEMLSDAFAASIRHSSNYYVIFCRSELPNLPYSVDEIYRIKTSGKYHTFEPLYKQIDGFRYTLSRRKPAEKFDALVTEDSKSGLQFYKARLEGRGVRCETAFSNSGISKWLLEHADERVFVVADGAAFGPYADRVLQIQESRARDVVVCLPESFEWLLLRSGLIKDDSLSQILANPGNYIESAEFFSWEQFFTDYLRSAAKETPFAYQKGRIAEAYLLPDNASKVMALIACGNVA